MISACGIETRGQTTALLLHPSFKLMISACGIETSNRQSLVAPCSTFKLMISACGIETLLNRVVKAIEPAIFQINDFRLRN